MNLKRLLLIAFFLLAGCAAQPVTREQPAADLFETERLAAEAYENAEWLKSEKHYTVLVEQDPGKGLNWLRLGNIYASTDRPEAAILAYREALARDPELVNAWYNMGVVQLKQAAYSLNELQLHIDPDDPVAERSSRLLEGLLDLIEGNGADPRESRPGRDGEAGLR